MPDYEHLTLANMQINERVEQRRRSRLAPRRRGTGRHRVASGLHALANRIDS